MCCVFWTNICLVYAVHLHFMMVVAYGYHGVSKLLYHLKALEEKWISLMLTLSTAQDVVDFMCPYVVPSIVYEVYFEAEADTLGDGLSPVLDVKFIYNFLFVVLYSGCFSGIYFCG
ncbi:hypothetical protein CHS0354_015413 [Potamilus streckersoni]|uniref:Uncharacterized protein n=1 Tax=Potamilus streckersoni TaxID=2493646 RepID=A0AAE0S195_9BIVA|nr:hypothetical protein CHS0354_015413 [Potamilus streckersoni]